jgi:hypothetical protein
LKQTISQLEAVNDELQEQTGSAAARYDEVQQRRDLADSKFAELEHSREDTLHQLVSLKASSDIVTAHVELEEKSVDKLYVKRAATRWVVAVENKLSKTRVV